MRMTLEGIDTVHDMTHKTLKTMCPLKKIIVFIFVLATKFHVHITLDKQICLPDSVASQ